MTSLSRGFRAVGRCFGWMGRLAAHADPLAEASNWVAVLIGTHLPFWPLYVWWCAGAQAFPSALLTMAPAPVFLAVPLLSRRSSLLGRIAMVLTGVGNAVFTVWILGYGSGTALFLAPCAALAAVSFRHHERWLMVVFTGLPGAVWYILQDYLPAPLHQYDAQALRQLFLLNALSIAVLFMAFGWLQGDIYRRMERGRRTPPAAGQMSSEETVSAPSFGRRMGRVRRNSSH
jgi:hypothetical protein